MSIDLSQFHQVFFEESADGLDTMESALVELDPASYEAEVINSVFRAAHSIKGGAGTFGFNGICEFTHVIETLLDQIRSQIRPLSAEHLTLLLEAVDCLRELLAMAQQGVAQKNENSLRLQAAFEQILRDDAPAGQAPSNGTADEQDHCSAWSVAFYPHPDILQSGNDPLRIMRELSRLGDLQSRCDTSSLPAFESLDPELLLLRWDISGLSGVRRESIEEVFEWVTDEAEIQINALVSTDQSWTVRFVPHRDMLQSGNDPLKIVGALQTLGGGLKVSTNLSDLPEFSVLDPEQCFLAWNLELQTEASRAEIEEVFEWVEDQCELVIETAETQSAPSSAQVATVSNATVNDAVPSASQASGQAVPAATAKAAENTSIRVSIDKIDLLINMVGELVITQSMLGQISNEIDISKLPRLMEGLSQLEQNTRELQDGVMRIRMLPISFVFNRFPRLVKDLGQKLGKKIALDISGEGTELDKTVMEKIGDPLVHLVRNAIDHGIESPEERIANGKSETGRIALHAYHKGGDVVIVISDDGAGLSKQKILQKGLEKKLVTQEQAASLEDSQVYDLIFQPGFSTAREVTDVSGRGVGMDVVRKNIQALNGTVELESVHGKGSKITIRLPLTLAILDGQLVKVRDSIYIFPLVSIVESMQCKKELVNRLAGGQQVFRLRDEYVPVIELSNVFGMGYAHNTVDDALMVVVEADGVKAGVIVDELLSQQQVVIKSLEQNYKKVDGVSGATILGDGTVALIIDVQSIVKLGGKRASLGPNTRFANAAVAGALASGGN